MDDRLMTEGRHQQQYSDPRRGASPMTATELERINRYLSGTLPEADCIELEARMIGDDAYRAEVELSRQLRDGLRDLRQTGELDRLTRGSYRFWHQPAFGLAASAVAVMASLVALASYQQLAELRGEAVSETTPVTMTPGAATSVKLLRLVRTRSAGNEPDLTWRIDPTVGQLDLRIDVGLEPAAAYAFQLTRLDDGASIALLSSPAIGVTNGEVAVSVHATLLRPGRYEVTVRDPAGHGSSYQLAVIDE